ncbi:putative uncharacterized protein, putative [Babesia ovata]|uniref:Uncharacterized protein n=1 Tax=Babesia ovata TaxID=189622 RepID=A0A2H6KGM0_9APIC|nr:putative uncharacterized protein, putative [Babesia ovata]GBE62143.1 putative uncharacterized protein, putative [Babesia ovata]
MTGRMARLKKETREGQSATLTNGAAGSPVSNLVNWRIVNLHNALTYCLRLRRSVVNVGGVVGLLDLKDGDDVLDNHDLGFLHNLLLNDNLRHLDLLLDVLDLGDLDDFVLVHNAGHVLELLDDDLLLHVHRLVLDNGHIDVNVLVDVLNFRDLDDLLLDNLLLNLDDLGLHIMSRHAFEANLSDRLQHLVVTDVDVGNGAGADTGVNENATVGLNGVPGGFDGNVAARAAVEK